MTILCFLISILILMIGCDKAFVAIGNIRGGNPRGCNDVSTITYI